MQTLPLQPHCPHQHLPSTQMTKKSKDSRESHSDSMEIVEKPTSPPIKQDQPPRGIPVSGRVWKEPQLKPSSHGRIPKSVKTKNWDERVKARQQRESIKAREAELRQEKKEKFEKNKQLARERAKKKLENEKKAEVVQTISAAKVKRMQKRKLLGKGKSGIKKR